MSYSSLHCGDFLLSHSLMERAMHTAGCTLKTLTKPHAVLHLGQVCFQVPTAWMLLRRPTSHRLLRTRRVRRALNFSVKARREASSSLKAPSSPTPSHMRSGSNKE
jgi:hypothetical protein